jgi:hypothetical protein
MALWSAQPLTEIPPGIFLGIRGCRYVKLVTSPPSVSLDNAEASTSHKPMGLYGILQE